MQSVDRTLLKLDYFLAKQEEVTPEYDRPEAADDPRAIKHQVEENAPGEKSSPEVPVGKVRTKIYELVHRGGRTFERARTAWVNPKVAEHLDQRKKASDWIRTLGNYLPIYFVGGYVRDKFFKKVSKDLDLVATVDLEKAKEILTQLNIEFKEKNNSHARLSFMVGGIRVDLISTTGEELLNNLRSRDFTINAIAQSVTGQFYDPTRGLEDVKKKWLRSPNNDSVKAFENDPVRILRAARFLADYPLKPHPTVLSAIKKTKDRLSNKKKRRIGYELVKILQTEKPWVAMKFLSDYDILKYICSDLNKMVGFKQRGPTHKKDVWGHTLETMKNANSSDLVLNLAILFHDVGKPHTATDGQKSFPGHNKKSAQIAKATLIPLGIPKGVVKRVVNIVENHLFIGVVGTKGQPEEYRKLALTLGGDVDRFFKLSAADAAAHKIPDGYDAQLGDKVKAIVKKVKSTPPVEAGTDDKDDLKKSIDEVLTHLFKDEQRDYDPKGGHRGKRGGKYFLPGERETGGKQVEVVQAPEAAPEDAREAKFAAAKAKREGFVQGLLDPESVDGFFGDRKNNKALPWRNPKTRERGGDGWVTGRMITGKQKQMLLNNLDPLYNSKNRKNTGLEGVPIREPYKDGFINITRYGWNGSLFGGDERQEFILESQPNGSASLTLIDLNRQAAAEGGEVRAKEQVAQQVRDEDPLTDHFGGEVPQVLIQDWMKNFMQVPGRVPDAGTIVEMGKYLASKQTKTIPKEFATRLGDLSQYLDIEDAAGADDPVQKSNDLERILVEDSMNIILNYDSGVNDIDYILELVK